MVLEAMPAAEGCTMKMPLHLSETAYLRLTTLRIRVVEYIISTQRRYFVTARLIRILSLQGDQVVAFTVLIQIQSLITVHFPVTGLEAGLLFTITSPLRYL